MSIDDNQQNHNTTVTVKLYVAELLKVEAPDEYTKEPWQMSEQERLDQVPLLREEGNNFYRQQKYDAACESYSRALGFIEQLMLK